ncbi:MAG: aminopeptidase P family protein, partial [Pseudomonadota bacterium]
MVSSQSVVEGKLNSLRRWMLEQRVDAYCVPRADEYLGEYLPKYNERLHWLTGFTGSAGMAIVLADKAALFVDGRYTVQVRHQVSEVHFELCHLVESAPAQWLAEMLPAGSRVACDPRMYSLHWYRATQTVLAKTQIDLLGITPNPIDLAWDDRPLVTPAPALLLKERYSGESSASKRKRVGLQLSEQGADAALLFAPDSVSWILNLRGADVPCVPVLLSMAMLEADGSLHLLVDPDRVPEGFAAHVGDDVFLVAACEAEEFLSAWDGKTVLADPSTANAWSQLTLEAGGALLLAASDPVIEQKACKNPTEILGTRSAHKRDALAVIRFLAWLDRNLRDASAAPLSEALLADRLGALRSELDLFQGPSFDTISAAGANAAMCHYNHLDNDEAFIERDSVYLVDSGGQYLDGTTDITRTVATGDVGEDVKHLFTLVLKGHIALAQAKFPPGTTGTHLDALARQFLWAEGYDFDHGTGHGVGSFLSVHVGPQRIAKLWNPTALAPGMLLSNEPAYYRDGAFGIRCENLLLVQSVEKEDQEVPMLEIDPVTFVPFDRRLLVVDLLSEPERAWVDAYHQRILSELDLD